jgi:hypothetical protein
LIHQVVNLSFRIIENNAIRSIVDDLSELLNELLINGLNCVGKCLGIEFGKGGQSGWVQFGYDETLWMVNSSGQLH